MEIAQYILGLIKKNLLLFLVLLVAAGAGAFLHFKFQAIHYVSQFNTNLGRMEYDLVNELMDLENINDRMYDLPEDELLEIQDLIKRSSVSFIQGGEKSILFTISSSSDNIADHIKIEEICVKLLNSNIAIRNSYEYEKMNYELKLHVLNAKIAQMDSLFLGGPQNGYYTNIPWSAFNLYAIKVDLEIADKELGNFTVMRPVTYLKKNTRPLWLFIGLYLFLGGIIFFLLAKKGPKAKSSDS